MKSTETESPAADVRGVVRNFGRLRVLRGLDLRVPRGSSLVIFGSNGSGKTTLLRVLAGLLRPQRGELEMLGRRFPPDARLRARIGMLAHETMLYADLTAGENLAHYARLYGVRDPGRVPAMLERTQLADAAERPVRGFSRGMLQRLSLARALLHEPELLLLDEPFSGLDPINQDVLEEIVREFHARGTTILFSTHLMDQAERLCERVCLISKAEKVLDADLRELKVAERKGVVAVEFEGDDRWLHGPEIDHIEPDGGGLHLLLRDGADHQAILHRGVAAGATILRFDLVEPRLHEIFVRHAGADAAGDAGLPPSAAAAAGGDR